MNPDVAFVGLLVVAAVAFVVPIALAVTPARRIPAAVLLIVAGIALGPSGIGLIRIDLPIQIMALLGLALLLFLAGMEIEVAQPSSSRAAIQRGRPIDTGGALLNVPATAAALGAIPG